MSTNYPDGASCIEFPVVRLLCAETTLTVPYYVVSDFLRRRQGESRLVCRQTSDSTSENSCVHLVTAGQYGTLRKSNRPYDGRIARTAGTLGITSVDRVIFAYIDGMASRPVRSCIIHRKYVKQLNLLPAPYRALSGSFEK